MKLIDKNDYSAEVIVELPILKKLQYDGFPLSLGGLTLDCEGRNFIIDSVNTNYNFSNEVGDILTFDSKMEVDLETFPKDEDHNYELMVEDLENKKIKGVFFCSDQDIGYDEGEQGQDVKYFDYDNAIAYVVFYFRDGKEIKIDIELER